jgi:D-sedoheptulose 7-phosphate isomerase
MTPAHQLASKRLHESNEVKRLVAEHSIPAVIQAAALIAEAFRSNKKLLLCGNGGSAADCQHMAAEFVSRLTKDVARRALPAVALTTDTSFLTAFANDCGYEGIFERQVEALGQPADVLLGISTSGSSKNVIRAMRLAKQIGMKTIALVGAGGEMAALADVAVSVPSNQTQYVQESHISIEHIVCELVERELFPNATEGQL